MHTNDTSLSDNSSEQHSNSLHASSLKSHGQNLKNSNHASSTASPQDYNPFKNVCPKNDQISAKKSLKRREWLPFIPLEILFLAIFGPFGFLPAFERTVQQLHKRNADSEQSKFDPRKPFNKRKPKQP